MSVLSTNLVRFARVLRRAGVAAGPGQVLAAAEALSHTGPAVRDDVREALRATMTTHRSHAPVFDQAFDAFWRDGAFAAGMAALLPQTIVPPDKAPPPGARRVADAMGGTRPGTDMGQAVFDVDASGSASEIERLANKDFAQMSADEFAAARQAIGRLTWRPRPRRTRRFAPSEQGRIDGRRTLRAMIRTHGDVLALKRRSALLAPPPVVALVDISGSMSDYARMLLHFLHALTRDAAGDGRRISTFLFGTRLTQATRALKHRDPDTALAAASALAPDWDGGTRIGKALETFNRVWARRVLGQGAHVLLITDGLERDEPDLLAREAARLKASARGVTWANPLLRFDGFSPKAQGIRAILPHVSVMKPVHSLKSVAALAEALSAP